MKKMHVGMVMLLIGTFILMCVGLWCVSDLQYAKDVVIPSGNMDSCYDGGDCKIPMDLALMVNLTGVSFVLGMSGYVITKQGMEEEGMTKAP